MRQYRSFSSAERQKYIDVAYSLNEASHRTSEGEATEKILDFLFESMNQVLPFDRIGIALAEKQKLRLVWVRSKVAIESLKLNYTVDLRQTSLSKVFETGEGRIINDLDQYLADHPVSESTKRVISDGIHSNMALPLKDRGRVFGVIFFSSCTANIYTPEHERIFNEVADEVSMILACAQADKYFEKETVLQRSINMIVHDLKAPLATVQSFLEMAQSEEWYPTLDQGVLQVFQVLRRNTEVMTELVMDLAELSSLNVSEQLSKRKVALDKFYEEVSGLAKMLGRPKGIQVQVESFSSAMNQAAFDVVKIRRVIMNLVSNAVKFSPRNSVVILRLEARDGRIFFSVCDNGPGIPQAELGALFKEFGRTSVRPTDGEHSTGLGLAIAKKIVEMHGGEITVRSEQGNGSQFEFWLPNERAGDSSLAH